MNERGLEKTMRMDEDGLETTRLAKGRETEISNARTFSCVAVGLFSLRIGSML